MYIVQVNKPDNTQSWPWPLTYFPRKYKYLKEAKKAAQSAINHGSLLARIEYPNGAELDFRPKQAIK